MSSSNSWAEFATLFRNTREAYLEHERAKCELKAVMREDAREAIGHGVRGKPGGAGGKRRGAGQRARRCGGVPCRGRGGYSASRSRYRRRDCLGPEELNGRIGRPPATRPAKSARHNSTLRNPFSLI